LWDLRNQLCGIQGIGFEDFVTELCSFRDVGYDELSMKKEKGCDFFMQWSSCNIPIIILSFINTYVDIICGYRSAM
jgi:hypothetical protein